MTKKLESWINHPHFSHSFLIPPSSPLFPPPILPLTCITSITSSLLAPLSYFPFPLPHFSSCFLFPYLLPSYIFLASSLLSSFCLLLPDKKENQWLELKNTWTDTDLTLSSDRKTELSARFHWIIRKLLNCFLLCEQRDTPDVKRTILPDRWAQTLQWAAQSAKTGPSPESWTHQTLWCVTRKLIRPFCWEVISETCFGEITAHHSLCVRLKLYKMKCDE